MYIHIIYICIYIYIHLSLSIYIYIYISAPHDADVEGGRAHGAEGPRLPGAYLHKHFAKEGYIFLQRGGLKVVASHRDSSKEAAMYRNRTHGLRGRGYMNFARKAI